MKGKPRKRRSLLGLRRRVNLSGNPKSSSAKKEQSSSAASPTSPFQINVTNGHQHNGHPEAEWQPSPPPRVREIPSNYGDNLIYIMVRDPHWIYAYWEIQNDHQERTLQSIGGDWGPVRSILRVYNVTEKELNAPFFDITLEGLANHWFINVYPNTSYIVEIGLLHRDGRFAPLARSNRVTTPRSGMSEILDEQWMGIDFDRIYALSGGLQMGKSSLELRKMMEERLRQALFSWSGVGAITSIGSPVRLYEKQRGFWFWVDCELVFYGATEPDAKVTLQGREVKLRPDGSFSFRYALPDGKIALDAVARSADGVEERKIVPVVERKTQRPEPVIRKK